VRVGAPLFVVFSLYAAVGERERLSEVKRGGGKKTEAVMLPPCRLILDLGTRWG
jgi:hypothetical protein